MYKHSGHCGIKCLQPVDRRQVEAWIGEGHQFAMDQIPVTSQGVVEMVEPAPAPPTPAANYEL